MSVLQLTRGRRGRDRMVVGFTTTYAISAYHHYRCELEPRSGEVFSIQHYVIKYVSDLWHVGGFHRVLRFPIPIKCHDITEILLKVALNTITLTLILMVIGTGCTGNCKSNYHTITTTTTPIHFTDFDYPLVSSSSS